MSGRVLASIAGCVVGFAGAASAYQWETAYFTQDLDHFNFENSSTFQEKYLVSAASWKAGGPIFFYTGNEGPIELFAENTGFMWELAAEFGALVVFAEHRYYGTTLPFGNATFADPKSGLLQWLTSEQALADYAELVAHLKTAYNCAACAVVSFGGSYGGMLSAWFRVKHPSSVDGAIAASAPILQFTGLVDPEQYSAIITRTFESSGAYCAPVIGGSWARMEALAGSVAGLTRLSTAFQLCSPLTSLEDVETNLFQWLNTALQYATMADYPYPASFLGPMPAWPVKAMCDYFTTPTPTDDEMLASLMGVAQVFFNWTGESGACFNVSEQAPSTLADPGGWNYQACTEMVMPIAQAGWPTDLFWSAPWNLPAYIAGCEQQYGVTPRPDWVPVYYGGAALQGSSNIVFSNGNLDPWSGGGVLTNVSDTVVAYVIENGAHHLDLRASDPADPPTVLAVRGYERAHVAAWIAEAEARKRGGV